MTFNGPGDKPLPPPEQRPGLSQDTIDRLNRLPRPLWEDNQGGLHTTPEGAQNTSLMYEGVKGLPYCAENMKPGEG